jgi:hypothetical protein
MKIRTMKYLPAGVLRDCEQLFHWEEGSARCSDRLGHRYAQWRHLQHFSIDGS